jgi:hypothetical protein
LEARRGVRREGWPVRAWERVDGRDGRMQAGPGDPPELRGGEKRERERERVVSWRGRRWVQIMRALLLVRVVRW